MVWSVRNDHPTPIMDTIDTTTAMDPLMPPRPVSAAAHTRAGKVMTSPEFAKLLAKWRDQGCRDLAFLIGGADGLAPELRDGCDHAISFGKMVWPHMLARAMLAEGRLAEVQSLMEQVPEELLAQPEIISLAGMIGLAEQAASLPDTATLQAAVDANADDHSARHTLAQALLGRGQPEAGADHLLEIMRRDRAWNDDGARQALLTLFDALGQSAPLTVTYRKKLSALLFS